MQADSIEHVVAHLRSATSYSMIFGKLPDGSGHTKKSTLRKQFAYLAQVVHPDHAPKTKAAEAVEAFRLLNEARQAAEKAIEEGTYDQPIKKSAPKPDETF